MRLGERSLIPTFEPSPPLVASAYPDDIGDLAAGLSDEQALRKIGQRSSLSGKLVTLAMIGGAVGLGWFYVQRSGAYDSRMDGILAAGKLEGAPMLEALRGELEKST